MTVFLRKWPADARWLTCPKCWTPTYCFDQKYAVTDPEVELLLNVFGDQEHRKGKRPTVTWK